MVGWGSNTCRTPVFNSCMCVCASVCASTGTGVYACVAMHGRRYGPAAGRPVLLFSPALFCAERCAAGFVHFVHLVILSAAPPPLGLVDMGVRPVRTILRTGRHNHVAAGCDSSSRLLLRQLCLGSRDTYRNGLTFIMIIDVILICVL